MKYYDAYCEKIRKINASKSESKHNEKINDWYEASLLFPFYDYNV